MTCSVVASLGMRLLALALLLSVLGTIPAAAQTQTAKESWWNEQWSQRKKITIDASPTGVSIAEPIGTSPVLVRLHAGNFGPNFQEAKPDGSDLRFVAADDKTPISFQVERYDAAKSEALIWVKVPNITPNAKTEFWLYWGSETAPELAAQDGKAVFDSDTKLAYHFTENNLPAQDATVFNSASQSITVPAPGAIIGQGVRLGGEPVAIPGTPALGWGNNASLTIMGWFRMTAPQSNAVIYSRRNQAAGLIIGVDNGVPFVEVAAGTGTQRATSSLPMEPAKWNHLAVVADGTLVTLYLNGNGVATLIAQVPELKSVAFLGGDSAVVAAPALETPAPGVAAAEAPAPTDADTSTAQPTPAEGDPAASADAPAAEPAQAPEPAALAANPGFAGEADEFSIAFAARSPGFVRLAAIGQGGERMSQLVSYSVAQQTSAWLTGTYGVLIKSVKPLEWGIIGFLGLMLLASVWVMVSKHVYVSRQAKANAAFSTRFRRLSADLDAIDHGRDMAILTETDGKSKRADKRITRNSSMLRLYRAGIDEVKSRVDGQYQSHQLTAEGLASIRATLDAVLVREMQALRSRLIVLTIAISGGPFLGLLGTVTGVMTTFAAIALSGEVNVNSIAPGIAGALVATVAGLVVAIPALFVYNILITRVNDLTADMQVFADEFITKMSEHYASRPAPMANRAAAE